MSNVDPNTATQTDSVEMDIVFVDNRGNPPPTPPSNPILDALALTGITAIGEQPSMLSNLVYSNTVANNDLSTKGGVANQNAHNKLGLSIVAKAVTRIQNSQPLPARTAVDVLSNNELAQTIADLKAAVEAFGTVPAAG